MSTPDVEGLLRELAPAALGAVVRRYGDFADAEDAVQEALSPNLAIPLTLRALAGLTTREIAAAYLVPEATMAQRISRAKAKLGGERFGPPQDQSSALRSVLEVLYLLFNEGYASSSGPDLARTDLSGEAVRLVRLLLDQLPENAEVEGLLALMLLTDARRPARTGATGELVPLAEQDRHLWDRSRVSEGMVVLTAALRRRQVGEYQLLASIAGLHDKAPSYAQTRWADIASLYGLLERMTGNPVVTLNRAVAVAMVDGARSGLALLEDVVLDTHRLYAVRAHLLEEAGDLSAAAGAYGQAASRATNLRERDYHTMRAARLGAGRQRTLDRAAGSTWLPGDIAR